MAEAAPVSAEATGSLWAGQSGLLADAKASRVGDLVTVLVNENASAKRKIGMNKNKKHTHSTQIGAMLGFEKSIAQRNRNFTPGAAWDVTDQRAFSGAGGAESSDQIVASVSAVVTKVYPNGVMRIVGHKVVMINGQPQAIRFTGLIRRSDIGPDNTIPSSKVANARIEYGGGGELSEAVHEGWLSRTLEQIWPF
ncbi:MAG: flagellar basal body L-ring protein FlgH [Zetaproteobacteria bacterium]|nr:MAG: flagellar basal body L-ring protein FlgH [Zetaproteobacteria bacterium]